MTEELEERAHALFLSIRAAMGASSLPDNVLLNVSARLIAEIILANVAGTTAQNGVSATEALDQVSMYFFNRVSNELAFGVKTILPIMQEVSEEEATNAKPERLN